MGIGLESIKLLLEKRRVLGDTVPKNHTMKQWLCWGLAGIL